MATGITFKRVAWKNLLSYGNDWTTINLATGQSTLIVGTNGAGKSTMLDALCFGLFGKPFRKITKPKIPNSVNDKDVQVIVEFSSGGKTYIVHRTMKPDSLTIYVDGVKQDRMAKAADQQKILETQILRFNQKSFTQIVVLGSATFQPFMQLGTSARRAVIEDLLDITVIGEMATIAKRTAGNVRSRLSDASERIRILEERERGKASLLSKLRSVETEKSEALKAELEGLKIKAGDQKTRVDKLIGETSGFDEGESRLSSMLADLEDLRFRGREISRSIDDLEKTLESMRNPTDVCSKCGQPIEIDEGALGLEITQGEDQLGDLKAEYEDLKTSESDLLEKHSALKSDQAVLSDKRNDLSSARAYLAATIDSAKQLVTKIKESETGSNQRDIAEAEAEIQEIRADIRDKQTKLETERKTLSHVNAVSEMLKDDGIKARIVSTYLPAINTLVNKYLEDMGFNVSFHLDESFEETIKSRHRDRFSYFSFSEGEKQRIDLALLFTWREIARLRNSANTNLIVMDEVMDGSLDAQGLKDFIGLLEGLSEGTSSFVISHNPDFVPQFDRIMRAEKRNGFSVMKDVTGTS